ncbi:MAG: PEGA domain-containing protein [Planctomycetota bacterium]|jgi:hypothetical protein
MEPSAEKTARRPRWVFPVAALLLTAGALACLAAAAHVRRRSWLVDLTISTNPPGCGLHLDGRYVGFSPVVVSGVAQGNHFVRAEREGYVSRTVRAAVFRGPRQTVSVELRPQPVCRLELTSDPPGATVMLDGGERGTTPLVLENVRPGDHRLVLRRARHEPWSRSVKLEPGGSLSLRAEMEDSFLKFLDGAVASDPRNMSHRAERLHYMMTIKEFEDAGAAFFDGLRLMVCEGVPDASKGGLWHWVMRDAGLQGLDGDNRFAAGFARELAALAKENEASAAKILAYLGARSRYRDFRRRNPKVFLEAYFRAAAKAAGSRQVAYAALAYATELRQGSRIEELLLAAEKARPGDAENVGQLAIRVISLIKAGGIGGSFRGQALAHAAASVRKALDAKPADAAMRARLRRVLAKAREMEDKPAEALEELSLAITALAGCGAEHTGRLGQWKLEKALLLVEMRRTREAAAILKALAAGATEASVRAAASRKLGELKIPEQD